MKLVTSAQMRALEDQAVEAGTSLDALMEEAGLAVAQEAWLTLGVVAGRRVLVLAGTGNNGGDGLVAARHLADWDAEVIVYLLAPRPQGDPKVAQLIERGVAITAADADEGGSVLRQSLDGAELIVDALLGTGRSRPIEGALAAILRPLQARMEAARPPKIIAVDLPTGVDADSGHADALAVRADLTVTFGLAKVGLFTLPGSERAGRVQVIDIGLPKDAVREVPLELLDTAWVRARLPDRPRSANKGTFGRVLVIAGSAEYVGAARLAAEACYRTGAGLVTIACTRPVQQMLAPSIAEATWLPLDDEDGAIAASNADLIRERLSAYDVLLIGPGLGQTARHPRARRRRTERAPGQRARLRRRCRCAERAGLPARLRCGASARHAYSRRTPARCRASSEQPSPPSRTHGSPSRRRPRRTGASASC